MPIRIRSHVAYPKVAKTPEVFTRGYMHQGKVSSGGKKWTQRDETYLREKISSQSFDTMAAALGRSTQSVVGRCMWLGIFKR